MSINKKRGTNFETTVVKFLRTAGFPYAERRALHGNLDKGDVTGCGPLVFECKAAKRFELTAWLQETEQERINANADFGVLVVKRQGFGTGEGQYAVMRLDEMARLLKQAGY